MPLIGRSQIWEGPLPYRVGLASVVVVAAVPVVALRLRRPRKISGELLAIGFVVDTVQQVL